MAGYSWRESNRQTQLAQDERQRAEDERQRAEAQLLAASINLAKAHEEAAVGILNKPEEQRGTEDYRKALLQALQAERQPIGGRAGVQPLARNRLGAGSLERAFAQRWESPSPNLGSPPGTGSSPATATLSTRR